MNNKDATVETEKTDTEELKPSDKRVIESLRRLPLETRKRGLQECENYLANPVEHMKALEEYVAKQHEHNKARYLTHPEEATQLNSSEKELDRKLAEDQTPQLRKYIRLIKISLEDTA